MGVLVGRADERRTVENLIAGLPGSGGALVLRGDAGLGKSTLLAEGMRLAASSGFRVLRATGVESAAQVAFAGLEELLRPVRNRVASLAPPQRAAISAALGQTDAAVPDLFLIALATLNLVSDAAAQTPVLLAVEDGQWLDRETAEVVAFLARRLEFEPIALLVAVRSGYPGPLDDAAVPRLDLSPLPETVAAALLDTRFPALPAWVRNRVLEEAAGNPLALVELPVGLVDPSAAVSNWLPLSERLERAFGARMTGLPAATLLLLLVAAVDEGDSLAEVLAAGGALGASALPAGAAPETASTLPAGAAPETASALAVDDLEPAVDAGLVEIGDGRLRFRHPLVRSAIVQRATAGQRQQAHAALARVLDGEIERRAWHRGASVLGPDDDTAAELDAAGARALRRGGIGAAVAAFERAAQLSTASDERAERLLRTAELAAEMGQHESVVRLLAQAESLNLNTARRATAAWIREAFDDGIRDVLPTIHRQAELAERLAADGETGFGRKVLWRAAICCYLAEPGDDVRRRVVAVAERLCPDPADPLLLAVLGFVAPIERGRAVHDALIPAIAQADGDPTAARLLGNAAMTIGAFDVALAMQSIAVAGLRSQGRLALLARAASTLSWCALHVVDLGAAIPSAEEAVRLARETSQPGIGLLARAHASVVAAMRGDQDAAEQLATDVEREALPAGVRPALADAQVARGLSALGVGRYSDAFEHLRRVYDPADPAYHVGNRCCFVGDVVEAGLRSGCREEAQRLLTEMEAVGLRTSSPALHVQLRYARALMGDEEELFRTALRADLARWPFARARALLAYGEWLRRHRRPAEARPHLRAAREAFDALGVAAWSERARSELRASGETSRGRVARASELLTPQELQIAQMAAEGLTNREIGQKLYLSHRTISTHLHRIYPKLGVTSRGALATALAGTVT